ncbi:MAG: flippase [Clostridiales bacterium]|nr:flippase [Clostridiales bacterium]
MGEYETGDIQPVPEIPQSNMANMQPKEAEGRLAAEIAGQGEAAGGNEACSPGQAKRNTGPQKHRVAKNAAWLISGRIVQSLMALVVGALTARYLGPSNFGSINYAASLTAFIAPALYLGLNATLVHELVKRPKREGEVMGTSLVIGAAASFVCFIGVCAFAFFVNASETEIIIVCCLYSVGLLFQAGDMLHFWFQAKLQSKYFAISTLIAYTAVSAYRVILLITHQSVYWFALSAVIDHGVIALVLFITYRRRGGARLSFSKTVAGELFQKSKHYILPALMVSIFAQTDKLMLKWMIGQEVVGYYSTAVAICGLSSIVCAAVINSFRPVIFENKEKSAAAYEGGVTQLYSVIIYISIAQCAGIMLLNDELVSLLYGANYAPAAPVILVLVWYTGFSYLGAVRNIWMLGENKQKLLWKINLSGVMCNIALNLLLIPLWGTLGAAAASLVTQLFTNVLLGFVFRDIRRNNTLMARALDPRQMRIGALFSKGK